MKKLFNNSGIASMAEIVLVSGIFMLLMGLGIFSLTRFQNSSSLTSVVDTFLSDFKDQQIKAMQGDTESGLAPDNYGIHFDSKSYTIFRGATYSAGLNLFVINTPSSVEITNFFPDNQILFIKGSGEVSGCCTLSSFAVTFKDTSANIEKTITVNRMGTTAVN